MFSLTSSDRVTVSKSIRKRVWRYRAWRAVTAFTAITLVFNMSALGAILQPGIAQASNPSADLDQCANDPAPSPSTDGCSASASDWVNGNLGASKSVYYEGDSVPYRMRFDNLTLASHTVTIEWDTTKSGKHALDYITSYDRTVATANPTLGVSSPGSSMTFAIPADPQVTGAGVTPVAGNFTMWGGTITSVSAYSYPDGSGFTGDKSAQIDITFTATNDHPTLAWGGHISNRADWGASNSAVAIPGSPYHTRLIDLDGSGGNQDRSLSAEAVIFPASITIVKDAVPNDAQDFAFTTTGGLTPASFSLDDDANATLSNTRAYSGILVTAQNGNDYTVAETAVSGWTLSFNTPVCTVTTANGGSQSASSPTVTINLKEGENVSCTFNNERQAATVTVIKHVVNDNGGSAVASNFTMNASGTNVSDPSFPGSESGTVVTVDPGSYSVTEDSFAGYASSFSTDCTGTVAAGQNKTCTVTNNDVAPTLTLIKTVVTDNDGTKQVSDFPLFINGQPTTSETVNVLQANTLYTASETTQSGYTPSAWGGDCAADGTITLNEGDVKSCTITNNDIQPKLTVTKVVVNDDGGDAVVADFPLFVDQTQVTSGAQNGFNVGSYTVSETQLDGYTATISGDCAPDGTVTLAEGDVKSCTITNNDIQPKLTVTKVVVNDNGGTKEVSDFPLFVDQTPVTSGAQNGFDADTYTVSETEQFGYDATISGDCAANGTITLNPGDVKSCTITNDDIAPRLTVIKHVVPGPGATAVAGDFTMNVDATNVSDPSFPGDEAGTIVSLNEGGYVVSEDPMTGYTGSFSPDCTGTISVGQEKTCTVTNTRDLGRIDGTKFNDLDGDGVWDQGEPGVESVTIHLSDGNFTVTAGDGTYSFEDVPTGTYNVNEDVPSGWQATTPNPVNGIQVVKDQTTTVNFGNFQNVSVQACKIEDADGNLETTDDQSPVPGWTVHLSVNGQTADTQTTGEDGCYTWADLDPGVSYDVSETVPASWTALTDTTHDFDLAQSGTDYSFTFANFENASISGHKFNDVNGNGQFDEGVDPPISGWTIYLAKDLSIIDNTTTAPDGSYSFTNLGPGTYTVSEDLVTGWLQTFPPQPGTHVVQMISGANVTDLDFGNFQLGRISGYKFNDLNGNGTWEENEPALDGWSICLNGIENCVVTGAGDWPDGYYEFANLTAGSYDVYEHQQEGWTQTTENFEGILVQSGTDSQHNDFGNFRNITISGNKWNDLDGDGPGGPQAPIEGWEICLSGGSLTEPVCTQTDVNGAFSFLDLGPGTYTLTEESRPGEWIATSPTTLSDLVATSGQNITDQLFFNFQLGTISGFKFEDLNGNGSWDEGEPGLNDWEICVDNGVGFDDCVTTGVGDWPTGYYEFTGLNGGDYTLTETLPGGWTQTAAPSPVHVSSGTNSTHNDFGNFKNVEVQVCKYVDLNGDGDLDADPLFTGEGGWPMTLDDETTQNTVEGCTTFPNVGPGDHSVMEGSFEGWVRTFPESDTIDFTTASGENRSFAFGNFQTPMLTVIKHVVKDNGGNAVAGDFTIDVTATNVSAPSFPGDEAGTTVTLDAGAYSVDETGPSGYAKTLDEGCSGTVQSGDHPTCTITNDDIAPRLTVIKHVVPGPGATAVAGDFTLNVDATNVSDPSFPGDEAGTIVSLNEGAYAVSEDPMTGYTGSFSQDCTGTIAVGESKTCTVTNTRDLGRIDGTKFNDLNGDGVWDQGEPGLPDFTIHLSDGSWTVTASDGTYSFENVPTGTYNVNENVPSGWQATTPNPVNGIQVVKDQTTTVNFGNFQLGKISGYKLDWNENPLDGWQICLTGGNLNGPWCVITGDGDWPDGYFEFDGLFAGTYTLSETEQFGWTQFYPESGSFEIVVTSGTGQGEEPTLYYFGNRLNEFDVSIDKLAASTVQAGDQLTFTLNWSVSGNIPIDNVTITDPVPANTTFVSASNGGTENLGVVTWNLGTKNPGDSGSVTMTVQVATPLQNGTLVNNSAQICGEGELVTEGEGPTEKCDGDRTTTTVVSDFTVDVEKTGPATVDASTDLTYTITWSVSGNSPIDNLVLTDAVPTNTTFVSASNGGTETAGTVTWNLGSHAPGDNGSVTLTVHVVSPLTNGTIITNTANLCGTAFDTEEEEMVRCDEDTTTTTINSLPILGLTKTDAPDPVDAGSNITYTVTWSVTGNSIATLVTLTDPIPTNTTFVSADSGGVYDAGTNTITWNLGNQNPGSTGQVHFVVRTVTPIANGTIITNVASIDSVETDPAIQASATTTVLSKPVLSLTKVHDKTTFVNPGAVVTYTVTIKNTGTDAGTNLVLTDTLPSGFTFEDTGLATKTIPLGNLAAGQEVKVVYRVVVGQNVAAGTYENLAVVTASNHDTLTAKVPIEVRVPVVLGIQTNPVLTLEKTVNPTSTNPGKQVTYTVTIKNSGDGTALNVRLEDFLPAGLSFAVSNAISRTWAIGDLAPGESKTIKYKANVDKTALPGVYENLATVSADNHDRLTAEAPLTVKKPRVLGAVLPLTGAMSMDWLLTGFAALLFLAGLALLFSVNRRREDEAA